MVVSGAIVWGLHAGGMTSLCFGSVSGTCLTDKFNLECLPAAQIN